MVSDSIPVVDKMYMLVMLPVLWTAYGIWLVAVAARWLFQAADRQLQRLIEDQPGAVGR